MDTAASQNRAEDYRKEFVDKGTTPTSSETDNCSVHTEIERVAEPGSSGKRRWRSNENRRQNKEKSRSQAGSKRRVELRDYRFKQKSLTNRESSLDSGEGGGDEEEDDGDYAVKQENSGDKELSSNSGNSERQMDVSGYDPNVRNTGVISDSTGILKRSPNPYLVKFPQPCQFSADSRLLSEVVVSPFGESATLTEQQQHKLSVATYDSAVSTMSTPSAVSVSMESRVFSSPSNSERSKSSISPKRPRSPELTKALRLRQEKLKRNRDIDETRIRLKCQHVGEKRDRGSSRGQSGERAGSAAQARRPVLERARSEDSSKSFLRHLAGKDSSCSLGSMKEVEERYSRRKTRSKSDSISKSPLSYENKGTSPDDSPMQNTMTPPAIIETSATSEVFERAPSSLHDKNYPSTHTAERPVTLTPLERRDSSKSSRSRDRKDKEAKKTSQYSSDNPRSSKSKRSSQISKSESVKNALPADDSNPQPALPESSNTDHPTNPARLPNEDTSHGRIPPPETALDSLASAQEVEKTTAVTMDAILRDGLPDIPALENTTESVVIDWRGVFRVEMMRLRREVNEFRKFCQDQIKLHALALENSWSGKSRPDGLQSKNGLRPSEPPRISEQLKDLEVNMELFQKKQRLLDLETEILAKEERLSGKQKDLEEYEKEIIDVEAMLNHRQAICDRRQRALVSLDEVYNSYF
ncbi:pre-mRNA-splicing factor CWC22 homolog [Aplysia californica]|uniref:Pre-mRNA-splicing factor CWC22 homolog n=1 Tax=Aplysia californica TaxID=6500 RepID=A0ABM1VPG0_APLCA|nr:pre-mRNA-splicing factor CWC22 homolog [Aplysia californica]